LGCGVRHPLWTFKQNCLRAMPDTRPTVYFPHGQILDFVFSRYWTPNFENSFLEKGQMRNYQVSDRELDPVPVPLPYLAFLSFHKSVTIQLKQPCLFSPFIPI
jgi:hypothetical protein